MDATTTTGAPTERETVEAVLADPTLIRPVFQPIVDLRRSAVQGYEMLARLANDPSGTPPRWLAAAERLGMSNALEASLVAAGITAREHLPRGTYLSINVSPGALVSSEVRAVLDAAPGGLEQLVFELTEQHGIDDYDGLATALDGVRAAGGHVAVEDAGAGYDSLQHVLRLRPEYVKLDRGLISDAHADPAKLAIIEAVGLFAGRLGAELVAPGIERRAEQEMLAGLAVPLGQGYLFGRPGPSLVRDVPIAGLRPVTGDLGGLLDGPIAPTLDAGLLAVGAEPPAAARGQVVVVLDRNARPDRPARARGRRLGPSRAPADGQRPGARDRRRPPRALALGRHPPGSRSARACPTAASPASSASSGSWATATAPRTPRSCFPPASDAQAQAPSPTRRSDGHDVVGDRLMPQRSAHQLVEFLTAVSAHERAEGATAAAAELAAEQLGAEVGAVVVGDALAAATGFGAVGLVHAHDDEVDLPGLGRCWVARAEWDADRRARLVVARRGTPFSADERTVADGHGAHPRARAARRRRRGRRADAARAPSPARGPARHPALDLAPQAAVRRALRDHVGGQRPARRLPRRARPRRSARSRAPDRRRHHGRRRALGDRAGHRGHRRGAQPRARRAPTGRWPPRSTSTAPARARSSPSRSTGFDDAQLGMLDAFAEHASLALTDARTVEAMEEAFHDSLTGLPNRALFLDRLQHALDVAARRQTELCVLFVDLDRFKAVNDSIGHAAGDELLRAVAERLSECTRAADTAARFGGDEFAVLLEDDGRGVRPDAVAERIIAAMRRPFDVEGKEVFIGATVGIAHARDASLGPDELLRNADLAMYRAKKAGGNRAATYETAMRTALLARIELEADLRHALERDELSLVYQPVVELESGRTVGVEALARWAHPTRGMIPPLTFIPVAEEIGVIGAIGRWVLREACRQLAAWRRLAPGLVLNVNLSAVQLRDDRFAADVEQALRANGLPGAGAHARDHREHAPVRRRGHRGAPAAPEGPRAVDRRRRLRHRLLVAELPQAVPGRRAEDRQELRRHRRAQLGRQRAGADDRRAGARNAPGDDRRGHRDRRSSSSGCACSIASSARATTSPSRWTAPS